MRRWAPLAALLLLLTLVIPGSSQTPGTILVTAGQACPGASVGIALNPGVLCLQQPSNVLNVWTGTQWSVVGASSSLANPTITGTVAGGATYNGITADSTSTISGSTITGPTITGTVAGGATYTAPAITNPTITGTVAGGASYTSPTITGTVAGGASYTAPTIAGGTFSGTIAGTPTYSGLPLFNAGVSVQPGTNGTAKRVPARIFHNTTDAGNGADVTEDTLHTVSIPASTLVTAGQSLRLTTYIQMAANGDTKRTRMYFGATVIGDTTAVAFNNQSFVVICDVFMLTNTTQKAFCYTGAVPTTAAAWGSGGTGTTGGYNSTTPAETLSGAVVMKVTGQAGAANANDIIAKTTTIDWQPNGQ
jgi:hypothetical protein